MNIALTIAGSDSSGGAGIQADLKTFERFGTFGASALTLITAQNTQGVQAIHMLPVELCIAQLRSVLDDLGADAVKTGALGSAAMIEAVAGELSQRAARPLVVDPVMISKHGHPLLPADAIGALRDTLFPLATLITPNLHEASELLDGVAITSEAQMREAASALAALGPDAVLLKGPSLPGADEAIDILFDGETTHRFTSPRVATTNTHGTGCTYSAAIAAALAKGAALEDAVASAKAYLYRAISSAPGLGQGLGPVNHKA